MYEMYQLVCIVRLEDSNELVALITLQRVCILARVLEYMYAYEGTYFAIHTFFTTMQNYSTLDQLVCMHSMHNTRTTLVVE